MNMQAPNQNVMPQTRLQSVLNYLKQGHPVLPSQPMQPIVPNLSPSIVGQMPITDPSAALRAQGINRLRTQFQQGDAKNWMGASGQDAQNIDSLVRGNR